MKLTQLIPEIMNRVRSFHEQANDLKDQVARTEARVDRRERIAIEVAKRTSQNVERNAVVVCVEELQDLFKIGRRRDD